MRKVVLIFPCGSEIGLELHRALKYDSHIDLVGASSVPSNHGRFVFANYHDGLPYVDAPDFIEELNALIERCRIDLVFPAHDSVVLTLAEARDRLRCTVVGSPAQTCGICRKKSATYAFFADKVRVPKTYTLADDLRFPLFLKPDSGQGSKGTAIARSRDDVEFYLGKDTSLLLLEYLPGREYTIDCFTDRHGRLRFAGARERTRCLSGISVDTQPVEDARFQDIAATINGCLSLRGMWFFQLKETAEGDLALLEVAPRLAGGMALYRNLGVNFALLSVYDALGFDVDLATNSYPIQMDRALENRFFVDLAYDQVYVDLDDTLILRDTINGMLMFFLFQCRARGIKTHILSRHAGDIDTTLERHGLTACFDSVVHITDDRPKSRYITSPGAIFIDDSFKERREVHNALGIPTFAPDAIESLIDWRM